jgi:hypothetical protein
MIASSAICDAAAADTRPFSPSAAHRRRCWHALSPAFEQVHAAAMIVFDLARDQTLPSPRLVHCGRTDAAPDDD